MVSVLVFPIVAVLVFFGVGVNKYMESEPGQEWCLQGSATKTQIVCISKDKEEPENAEEIQGPKIEPHQNLYGEKPGQ